MGLSTFLRRQPLKPSLDLDFLKQVYKMNLIQRAFADIFTFSRASGGGRINASGQFEWVAANQPRFDYEPADIPVFGPELVTNSDFSNGTTGWQVGAGATISNVGNALQITNTGTNGWATNQANIPVSVGKTYQYSVTNKGATQITFYIRDGVGSNPDMVGLTVNPGDTKSGSFVSNTTGINIRVFCIGAAASVASVDDVSIKEITGYAVRKGDPKGILIEEQRTNLITYSSDYTQSAWTKQTVSATASAGIAPDGTNSMQSVARSTTAASFASFGVTKSASSAVYTYSQFFKAGTGRYVALRLQGSYPSRADAVFDLQTGVVSAAAVAISNFSGASAKITPFGNGVYRCEITATSDAWTGINGMFSPNSNGVVLDGVDSVATSSVLAWGGQVEQGSLATPYIPTSGSQVTRAADLQTETLSPWFNQSKGTVVWSGDVNSFGSGMWPGLFIFDDGGGSNRIGCYVEATGQVSLKRMLGGISSVCTSGNSVTAGARFKIAASWDASNLYISLNGGAVVSVAHGGLPTVSRLVHGKFDNVLNGHKAAFKYQQKTTIGAALQALSA